MVNITKKVLMIIAPSNFRDEELIEPKKVLEQSGVSVTVASKGVKESTGMLGAKVRIDVDVSKVDLDQFNAVVFIGGGGAASFFNDPEILQLAKDAYYKKKVIGAICIAPSILANAGILKGKNATSFHSESSNLRTKGCFYTGEDLTIDGYVITAKGPQVASRFGEALLRSVGIIRKEKLNI